MSVLKVVGFGFVLGCLSLLTFQVISIYSKTGRVFYDLEPFQQIRPEATLKIIFLGDSTAVGRGAQPNIKSVAGWFAQDFPEAEILNFGGDGERLNNLIENFPSFPAESFHLVILQIGGNDIMHFTPLREVKRDLESAIDQAQRMGTHVVVLHSGNLGQSPIFIWPFSALLTMRTKAVRKIYQNVTAEKNAIYVDLWSYEGSYPVDHPDDFYSRDHLHPSGSGYRMWYDGIRKTLNDRKIL